MKDGPESGNRYRDRPAIAEAGLVLIVTIVGGWLRLQNLGRDSLWIDEAASFLQACLPLWELLQTVARNVHPPLYYLLLHGVLTFGDSEAVLRWPSALFGTLSIPLLYLLGRAWFSGAVGILAAFLLAISPAHLWHSQDAKMYTLLTLEGLLSWHLFAQLLEVPRRSIWVGYLLVSEAILFTHYYGALLLFPQTGLVALLRHRGEVESSFWSRWLVVQTALALMFVPWIVYVNPSIPLIKGTDWIGEAMRLHPLWLAKRLANFSAGNAKHMWLLGLPVLAVALAGLLRDESRKWRTPQVAFRERGILLCLGYFAAPIAIMVAISLVRPLLVSRHMLMTAPAFFLLVAVGLSRLLPDRLFVRGAAVLAMLVLPGLIHRLSTPRTADHRGAAGLILANATAGDLVLFSPPEGGKAFEYYVRGRELRFRMCPRLLPRSSLEEFQGCLSDARRVWVVFSRSSSRLRKPTFMAPLAGQFRMIRTEELFRIRVALYDQGGQMTAAVSSVTPSPPSRS